MPLIEAGGATPLVERGIVTGDVRGLEVCRVVDEPTVGNFAELNDVPADLILPREEGVILEVGSGRTIARRSSSSTAIYPRSMRWPMSLHRSPSFRSVEAVQHPLNRMAPERFLRWQVQQQPHILGLADLSRSIRPCRVRA